MSYEPGFLKDRIEILNRDAATTGQYGIDGGGVEWHTEGKAWASVGWARGKTALNAGALDAYAVVMVRMHFTPKVGEHSRIRHQGRTYQVMADTFHADRQGNSLQFNAQLVIEP